MGKCLSRGRKVPKSTAELDSVPAKDTTQPAVVTEQMGITGSTDARDLQVSTPYSSSRMLFSSGAGEHSDSSADKSSRHASLMTQTASAEALSLDLAVERRIAAFFERYRDPESDCILADGIEHFCADVGVQPDEFSVLVLAWKFNAVTMCRFTREEFVGGCRSIGGADSPEGIRSRLPTLVVEVMASRERFRDLYRWSYHFGLDTGQRTLPLAMAISLWRLVFSQNPPPVLSRWISFLEQRRSMTSGIMRDTWDMFLLFTETIGDDLDRYDESEAWPSLIDDFVEYENDNKNHNVATGVTCDK